MRECQALAKSPSSIYNLTYELDRLMKVTRDHCSVNWGWTEDKKADGYGSISTWYATRRLLTIDDLRKVSDH